MKLIEAMKKVKDLNRKFDDLTKKIKEHAADLNVETSVYPNQKEQVDSWVQSCSDLVKEIERLHFAIQKTNLSTTVLIELEGREVSKTISQWILRRRDLSAKEQHIYECLNDRGLKDQRVMQSNQQMLEVNVRRYYDPATRDQKIQALKSEPSIIDGKLEVTNAVTDLME